MSVTGQDLRRPDPSSIFGSRATRGILWREWLQHGRVLCGLISLWIAAVWVTVVVSSPLWMLVFGVLYCAVLPRDVMGKDAIEGSEEFSFALPPTRLEQFRVRLLFCGAPLVALLLVGLVAIWLDLPQMLWGLIVETGFTGTFEGSGPATEATWIYSAVVPLAVFASVFSLAALAKGRGSGVLAWLMGIAVPGVVAIGCAVLESRVSDFREPTGYLAGPALLVLGLAALFVAQAGYARKEGVSRPSAVGRGSNAGWAVLAIIVLVGGLLLVLVFGMWVSYRQVEVRSALEEADRAERAVRERAGQMPLESERRVPRVLDSSSSAEGAGPRGEGDER